jgi:hypothetical protein
MASPGLPVPVVKFKMGVEKGHRRLWSLHILSNGLVEYFHQFSFFGRTTRFARTNFFARSIAGYRSNGASRVL